MFLFSSLLLASAVVQKAQAAGPFIVTSTADEVDAALGDGLCQTAAGACTLRAAIQEANTSPNADTIQLPAGTFQVTRWSSEEQDDSLGDFDIRETLSITGAGPQATIIDGNGTQTDNRVFQILNQSTVSFANLSIQHGQSGSSRPYGGGIWAEASTISLANVVVTDNSAQTGGGGVYASGGRVSITDSRIQNSSANFGGGLYTTDAAQTSIRTSTISNNTARFSGGGLYTTAVTDVTASTLVNNAAHFAGGAITNNGALTITNSTVSGNGIRTVNPGNGTGNGPGGGIYSDSTQDVRFINVTMANNTAPQSGTTLYNKSATPIRFVNTIIANAATDVSCDGAVQSLGHNTETGVSCQFTANGDKSQTNPKLGPLQDNGGPTLTHALLQGSPARDVALLSQCPTTDQRGTARPQGAGCDQGAYEAADVKALAYLPIASR